MIDQTLKKVLQEFVQGNGHITILTGAGISAESNIPTFRGSEGYWTIGSKEYHPQEMATYSMFAKKPDEVWKWYLYRMGVCKKAMPNTGHLAIVETEKLFKDRFVLITQNVDSLHIRAGNSLKRMFQIHGNIFYMRCADECSSAVYPLPKDLPGKKKNEELTEADRKHLVCPACGKQTRPHVLWFDETYNEEYYNYFSSLKVAKETELLIIIGTSGATNLPNRVVMEVVRHNGIIIDINIEETLFSQMALSSKKGYFIKAQSGTALPAILEQFNTYY